MGSSGSFTVATGLITQNMDETHPPSGLLPNISWLPCARGTPFMPRAITTNAIESRLNDDWFLKLASRMIQRGDAAQGKLFARLYCFMQDFIPGGLAGQRFEHLLGGDIMGLVLSSASETAPSRHKLTKEIEAAWQELETWMGGHSDWYTALQAANSKLTLAQQKTKRRDPLKAEAPGLVSPAGIVALLAIAHPDRLGRFTDRIEALQISWMFERRDILDVKGGFWDGINKSNVETCFRPLSLAPADTEMLVDYTRFFGKEFRDLQRDIRPGLPMWAGNLALESLPRVIDLELQRSDREPSIEAAPELGAFFNPIDHLRRLLTPAVMTTTHKQLLRDRLTSDGVMQRWALCWSEAARGPNRAIWQPLFYKSASVLVNFLASENADLATPEAYMLLDLYDAELGPSERGDFQQVLDRLEPFGACRKALNDLCRAAKWDSKAMTARLTLFAASIFKNPELTQYAKSTLRVEELRIRMILKDLPVNPRDMSVFDDMTVRRLGITGWQRRQLLAQEPEEVLTGFQLRLLSDPAAQPLPFCVLDRNPSALELLFAGEANTTPSHEHDSLMAPTESNEGDAIGLLDDSPGSEAGKDCDDFFAGLTAPRELKRPSSHDTLQRKKARFGGSDADLTGELQATHDMLRHKLLEDLRQDLSKLHEDVISKVQAEIDAPYRRIAADIQDMSDQVAALKSSTQDVKDMLTTVDTAVQESRRIGQVIQGAVANAETVASRSQEALQHMLSTAQAATHQLVKSEVGALKGPPVPAPGDLTFLAHNCPAPPGWSQKGYEAMTYRAASFYVSILGNPPAGFYGDEEAFKATAAEFPDLSQKHLVAALRHYHSLLYDRPFLRQPENG